MSTFDQITQLIYAKVWELSAPLPLHWFSEESGEAVTPDLKLAADTSCGGVADFTCSREKCGVALAGETGTLYNYIWLPCSLRWDGVEIFQEEHLWHATAPPFLHSKTLRTYP